jgi:beta-fructofuranosidase
VLGAATADEAHVVLFETEDPELIAWRYLGPIYSQPRSEMRFCECPNFFPLGDKFVLLLSPYQPVEYTVGDFDPDGLTFTPETHGILDPGVTRQNHRGELSSAAQNANFYATNIAYGPDGDCILFGWVRGFRTGQGWNGCLALPRVLTLGADGRPRQQPVPDVESLRGAQLADMARLHLDGAAQALDGVRGDALELQLSISLQGATRAGVRLRCAADGSGGWPIDYDGQTLRVNETSLALPDREQVTLRILLDRTVLEVFVNDGEHAITQVAYTAAADDVDVRLVAEGGEALLTDIRAWTMQSIW